MDLEEAIEYHKKLPDHKNFMKVAEKTSSRREDSGLSPRRDSHPGTRD